MSFKPSGPLKQPWKVKLLLAASVAFQELMGVQNDAQAQDKIRCHQAEGQNQGFTLPRALVVRGEDWSRASAGKQTSWSMTGGIIVEIWAIIPDEWQDQTIENDEDAHFFIEDRVGAIIKDMEALEGQGEPEPGISHISYNELNIADGPYLLTPEERDSDDSMIPESEEYENRNIGVMALEVRPFS